MHWKPFCFRVDQLYAFFVQWTPEIYGEEDDITQRGFIVLDEEISRDEENLEMMDEYFSMAALHKDWEVIVRI